MTGLAAIDHTDSSAQLVLAALLGIAAVVVLIVWLKVHPFVSLILGSAGLGADRWARGRCRGRGAGSPR